MGAAKTVPWNFKKAMCCFAQKKVGLPRILPLAEETRRGRWKAFTSFCIFLSVSMNNLCYLIKLLPLFPVCVIYSPFIALSTFVVVSSLYRIIKLLSFSHPLLSSHFYVIYAPHKCTCTTHLTTLLSLSLSRLFESTPSAPVQVSNSTGVLGHRAILMRGDRGMTGGFILEQTP